MSREARERGKKLQREEVSGNGFLQHLCVPKCTLASDWREREERSNGPQERSISRLFLTGHQMCKAETGEGHTEGTTFVAAAVITSKMQLCLTGLSPFANYSKIATHKKHTDNKVESSSIRAAD